MNIAGLFMYLLYGCNSLLCLWERSLLPAGSASPGGTASPLPAAAPFSPSEWLPSVPTAPASGLRRPRALGRGGRGRKECVWLASRRRGWKGAVRRAANAAVKTSGCRCPQRQPKTSEPSGPEPRVRLPVGSQPTRTQAAAAPRGSGGVGGCGGGTQRGRLAGSSRFPVSKALLLPLMTSQQIYAVQLFEKYLTFKLNLMIYRKIGKMVSRIHKASTPNVLYFTIL